MTDQTLRQVVSTEVADFRWNGYRCDLLSFDLDEAEHERRQACGLGAIASFTLIEPLMVLPEGYPVPSGDVNYALHPTLRRMPVGVLAPDRPDYLRLAIRPARNFLTYVKAKRWAHGHLDRASKFAPMGQRAIVLSSSAKVPGADELSEADFYGVGVGRITATSAFEWLLDPEPYRPKRFTAAAWRFAEGAYGAWLRDRALTGRSAAPGAGGSDGGS